MRSKTLRQDGFTILELLIATAIVSLILLMITTVMIGIQNLYYKGVNQEIAQNDVRTIVDQVDQEIRLDNAASIQPSSTSYGSGSSIEQAYCIGTVRYLYVTGLEVGSGTSQALWRDSTPEDGCVDTSTPDIISSNPTDGGTEYIASGARLTDFTISEESDGLYQVQVAVAIGNDNVLNPRNGYNAQCIGSAGDDFCATSSITTEVGERLQ